MKNILILLTVLFSYPVAANPHQAPLPPLDSGTQTTPAVQRTYTVDSNGGSYLIVVDGDGNLVLTSVRLEGSESDNRFVKPILVVVKNPESP